MEFIPGKISWPYLPKVRSGMLPTTSVVSACNVQRAPSCQHQIRSAPHLSPPNLGHSYFDANIIMATSSYMITMYIEKDAKKIFSKKLQMDGGVVDKNWGIFWSCLDLISSFFSTQILSFVVVTT